MGGALPGTTSGCFRGDIRTCSARRHDVLSTTSGLAGQGERPPLPCAHVRVPPAQAAPFLRKPTSPPQPSRCHRVRRHPPGWPCTPCPRRAAGEGGTYLLGPRCRPASPGWGGSSATHKRDGGVRAGPAPPPEPFLWGTRGTRCHRCPPARVPRLQRAAEAAAAPGQPRPLQQHRHRSPFFPDSHPISASCHASPPCVPAGVRRVCGRTRRAGADVSGPLPHGAISPPLSPSFFPLF